MKTYSSRDLKRLAWATLIGIGCAIVAIAASELQLFRVYELKTYDMRMTLLQKSRPAPTNVAMFYIDEPSLRHMERQGISWPWPRELYAGALDFSKRGGARAVVFDLFFSEDSSYGVADDETFAAAVGEGPPSYFVLFLSKNEVPRDERWERVTQTSRVPISDPLPEWMPKEDSLLSLPIEPLVGVATGFGNAQIPPDEDGVYRRIPLIEGLGDQAIPSIAFKVASDIEMPKQILWPKEDKLLFGGEEIPLDDDGMMMLNYYGSSDTFPSYPLAKILVADAAIQASLKSEIDPSIVKDKVVIIGVAAPGLYDLKPTPLAHVYPAPEVHATAIENILTADFITPLGRPAASAIALLLSLAVSLGLGRTKTSWGVALWIAALSAAFIGTSFFSFWRGIWVPVVAPFGALAISAFATIFRNYLTEGRKKRAIRRAFGQYLSPHVVAEISKEPERLSLGGVEQEVTLFFSDIADFTAISEKTSPTDLVLKLNDYFSKTTRIIHDHMGTLDKYIGDAIMAFWGAPLTMSDHASRACACALKIQKMFEGDRTFDTRIGIHTGIAIVGNVGSNIRFNYTAIGDAVNIASRLEGLNKQFGTRILVSESTYLSASGEFEARKIGRVRVKGRTEPIGVYEPLGPKGNFGRLDASLCNEFAKGLAFFESASFSEAEAIFKRIVAEKGDVVSNYYKNMCERYIREKPTAFEGVTTFTTK